MTKIMKILYMSCVGLCIALLFLEYLSFAYLRENPLGDYSGVAMVALHFGFRPLSKVLLGAVVALPILHFFSLKLTRLKKSLLVWSLAALLLVHVVILFLYFTSTFVFYPYLLFTDQHPHFFIVHGLLLGVVLFSKEAAP